MPISAKFRGFGVKSSDILSELQEKNEFIIFFKYVNKYIPLEKYLLYWAFKLKISWHFSQEIILWNYSIPRSLII